MIIFFVLCKREREVSSLCRFLAQSPSSPCRARARVCRDRERFLSDPTAEGSRSVRVMHPRLRTAWPSFSAAARPTPTPPSQMRSLAEVTWRPTSTPTTTLDPHACVPAARFSDPQGLHPEPSAHAHNLLLVDNTGREAVRLPGNVARMTERRLSSPGSSRRGESCPEGSE
jgi:hypothetical protein